MGSSATSTVLGVVGASVGFFAGGWLGAQIGFTVGATLGSIIDPPHTPGPKLGEASAQTSRDGIPIPIVWGTDAVVGNIIIQNPIVRETKKVSAGKGSGPTTTETRAYRDFGIGVCRGPIAGIARIWQNEKLVFDKTENPAIPADETAAFESGITIYLGTEDQLPEPDYEAVLGVGETPYFRGLAWVQFHKMDLTDFGQAIPTFRFEVRGQEGYAASSLTYALEAIDGADIGFTFIDDETVVPPIEGTTIGFSFVSAQVDEVLKTHTVDSEGLDLGFTFVSAAVDEVLKTHAVDPEGLDLGFTFVSAEVETVRISYEVAPEGVDVGFTFVSVEVT